MDMDSAKNRVLAAILAIVPEAVTHAAIPDDIPAIVPATIAVAVAAAIEASAEVALKRFVSSPRENDIVMISEESNANIGGVVIQNRGEEEDSIEVVSDNAVARGVQAALDVASEPEEIKLPPRCCVGIASKYMMGATLLASGLLAILSMKTPWGSKKPYSVVSGSLWASAYFLLSIVLGVLYWIKVNFEQEEDKYLGACVTFTIFVLSTINFIIENPNPKMVYTISVLNMVFTTVWGVYDLVSTLA